MLVNYKTSGKPFIKNLNIVINLIFLTIVDEVA